MRWSRLAFGVWRLAFGVWRLAFGVWRLAFGVWRLAAFEVFGSFNASPEQFELLPDGISSSHWSNAPLFMAH
jgi:hypothetical protein